MSTKTIYTAEPTIYSQDHWHNEKGGIIYQNGAEFVTVLGDFADVEFIVAELNKAAKIGRPPKYATDEERREARLATFTKANQRRRQQDEKRRQD